MEAWPGQDNALYSPIIDAMVAIAVRKEVDINRLRTILAKIPVNSLYQKAYSSKGMGGRKQAVFIAIADTYNKGLRGVGKRIPYRVKIVD